MGQAKARGTFEERQAKAIACREAREDKQVALTATRSVHPVIAALVMCAVMDGPKNYKRYF